MFCQQCGASIPEESVFCQHCGARQEVTTAATPATGGGLLMDEVFPDRGEVAEDPRYGSFPPGREIRLHAKVESGGPYQMLVIGPDAEVLKVFAGIAFENTFDFTVPEDGELGFDFESTGRPGTVRLQVY